jgi:phosphotransferase system  glucose/maltose/N-acetylglucosamine-specific IIC component
MLASCAAGYHAFNAKKHISLFKGTMFSILCGYLNLAFSGVTACCCIPGCSSTVNAMTEAASFVNKKAAISLSEQDLVDCDDKDGCNGG